MADDATAVLTGQIERFIAERLPTPGSKVAVSGLRRAGAGTSRENWAFDAIWTSEGRAESHALLLRRDPEGTVVATERAIEFGLLKALTNTDVPSPTVRWIDSTGAELARPSMIVDMSIGRADRAVLRSKDPFGLGLDGRKKIAVQLCKLLAAVHQVDVAATGIDKVLPMPLPTPAENEVRLWVRLLEEQELEPQPAMRLAARWLFDNLPEPPPRQVLVHGDYRPANVLVDGGGVSVLLDWELAHLGDPADDLGWYTTPLYRVEHFVPDAFEMSDFLQHYRELTGLDVPADTLRFWQVMAMFRLAVMGLTGVRSFCEGDSDRAAAPSTAITARVLDAIGEAR